MKLILILFSIMSFTKSCKSDDPIAENQQMMNEVATQKIFINGKIYTVNTAQPWAEAMIIQDKKIIFVGTSAEAQATAESDAQIIDLQGALVLPGIHDVHMHPMEVGSSNNHFEVSLDEMDPENYIDVIANAAADNPNVAWLIGFGHDINTLFEANRSPLEILDEAVPNRPVIIMEHTSHSMWVNSKALELAGITGASPNPQGGIIMKENDNLLTGILIDNAGDIVMQQAISSLADSASGEYDGMVEYVLPELAKYGITSVSDARTYWKRDQHLVWKQLEVDGKLTARFNLGLWAYPAEDDTSQIARLTSLYSNNSNSLLKINQIKLYADGITHNTTAALHSDYLIDYFEEPTNNGLNYFTEARIANYISQLETVGFDFHIHSIGNRGVTEALNAIAQGSAGNNRHRLTHVEIVNVADMPRFAQLNVTADAQVAGNFTNPAHWQENAELIGSTLADNQVPIKSLLDANARLTLSSDWNVSTLNPFVGIANAVSRAPQNISLEEAIKAYTINGAYVMRQENQVGSLEVGKQADFIVLDRDIFQIPTNEIHQTRVDMTVFNGTIIFER